jgi:uncharacterized membrane protein YqjE
MNTSAAILIIVYAVLGGVVGRYKRRLGATNTVLILLLLFGSLAAIWYFFVP